MGGDVLIDTSVWIEFFSKKGSPVSVRLQEYLKLGQVCYMGPIAVELYQGAKTIKEIDVLDELFEAIDYVEITREYYHKAGLISQKAARRGNTFSTTDMILATVAQEEGLIFFTLDTHFKEIAKYCSISLVSV